MSYPPFSEMLKLCGLSQREAAEFLNLSLSSVDKMSRLNGSRSRTVRNVPPGVSEELRGLYRRITGAVEAMLEVIESKVRVGTDPDNIVLCTYTDAEAREKGWPCAAPLNRVTWMTASLSEWDVRIEPYSGY